MVSVGQNCREMRVGMEDEADFLILMDCLFSFVLVGTESTIASENSRIEWLALVPLLHRAKLASIELLLAGFGCFAAQSDGMADRDGRIATAAPQRCFT
jgi:hypothetical protein